eukprot:scaffold1336_cov379-Prasinococcus_capsulatus_cf.AAC.10
MACTNVRSVASSVIILSVGVVRMSSQRSRGGSTRQRLASSARTPCRDGPGRLHPQRRGAARPPRDRWAGRAGERVAPSFLAAPGRARASLSDPRRRFRPRCGRPVLDEAAAGAAQPPRACWVWRRRSNPACCRRAAMLAREHHPSPRDVVAAAAERCRLGPRPRGGLKGVAPGRRRTRCCGWTRSG